VPEVGRIEDAAVVFISTEIGRGHPGYLDGLVEAIRSGHPHIRFYRSDAFSMSQGLSLAAWKTVRRMYRIGGRGGIISAAYGRLRRSGASTGGGNRLLHILGLGLRRRLERFTGPVVVAHPIVARILAPGHQVIYQHGEMAAPPEALVAGCEKILVPLQETAQCFFRAGYAERDMVITGQCIETDLVGPAGAAFEKRLSRLGGDDPLTAALFSSGAYPPGHLAKLRRAAVSLVNAGHVAYVFAGCSGKIASNFIRHFVRLQKAAGMGHDAFAGLHVIHSPNRADENSRVTEIFEQLDFFIAPAHERTNWAVGLGLPQIILTPHIGSYAPLNAGIALSRNVAVEMPDTPGSRSFADTIRDLRQSGRLTAMARNGYGKTSIDGFVRAAGFVADYIQGDR
jgi:hypothetical protein